MVISFDWLSFTIKPDKKSVSPFFVKLTHVMRLLGINDDSTRKSFFESDRGSTRYPYDHTYSFRGITIYACEPALFNCDLSFYSNEQIDKYYLYGINVEMKGTGCRYFEALFHDNENCYKELFKHLFKWVRSGAALNVCRVDFAFDEKVYSNSVDKESFINLSSIGSLALKQSDNTSVGCSSLYRSVNAQQGVATGVRYNPDTSEFDNYKSYSQTVYFGKFESNSFCRFYDKLEEQSVKCKTDKVYLRDFLSHLDSWVRFEIVFKNEVANKIMSAFVKLSMIDFRKFLASTINHYIRFVDLDDSNISRCPTCDWWAEFIGSFEHSKIVVHGIIKDEFVQYSDYKARMSNADYAYMLRIGVDAYIQQTIDNANPDKFTEKQRRMLSGCTIGEIKQCRNIDLWRTVYNPIVEGL